MNFQLEKGKHYTLSRYGEEDENTVAEYIGLRKQNYGDSAYYKPIFKLKEGGYCTVLPDVKIDADGKLSIVLDISDYYNSLQDVTKPTARPVETLEII